MRKPSLILLLFAANLLYGCQWDYSIWMIRSNRADPLYRFTHGDKAGYINQSGTVIIPPSLPFYRNHCCEFSHGLFEDWLKSDRNTYFDSHGRMAFSKDRYGYVGRFSEGLAPARPTGVRTWGYINPKGLFVIPAEIRADRVGAFSEGLATIKLAEKIGYIDRSGRVAIKPSFADASAFSGGFARVVTEGPCLYRTNDGPCSEPIVLPDHVSPPSFHRNMAGDKIPKCRFSFIDKAGRVITKLTFEDADTFSEGYAPVKIDGSWGYIDGTGRIVIDPIYNSANPFSNGRASVLIDQSMWGYIDSNGRTAIQPEFQSADNFSEGLAVVSTDGHGFFYIDTAGKQRISARFMAASRFYKGLAHVKLRKEGNHFAYIDRSGRIRFSYTP